MEDARIQDRKNTFVKRKFESGANRVERYADKIRKEQKEAKLSQKRKRFINDNHLVDTLNCAEKQKELFEHIDPILNNENTTVKTKLEILSVALQPNCSDELIYHIVLFIRKQISTDDPIFDLVFHYGFLPKLVSLLTSENFQILEEITWCLANFASTNYSKQLLDLNTHVLAMNLLNKKLESKITEHVIWILGNMSASGDYDRDILLGTEYPNHLLFIISSEDVRVDILLITIWALANLIRDKSNIEHKLISKFIPYLGSLFETGNIEICSECLWVFNHITDIDNHNLLYEVAHYINLEKLIKCLSDQDQQIMVPALRTLGNFTAGSEEIVNELLEYDIYNPLAQCLLINNSTLKKEVCWLISNLAAGPPNHIEALIDTRLINKVVSVMKHHANPSVKREAIYTIANACKSGDLKQNIELFQIGVMEIFERVLGEKNSPSMLKLALQGLDSMLDKEYSAGNGVNPPTLSLIKEWEGKGGVGLLEGLMLFPEGNFYDQITGMLDKYYPPQPLIDPLDEIHYLEPGHSTQPITSFDTHRVDLPANSFPVRFNF